MSVIARPDTIFEANFFNTEDGQAWTNLSDYVELNQGIAIAMRRQLVFNDVSAGTMSLYLDNSTGIFNNDRSDQPYFGLMNVDTPVRFRIRWPRVPTDTVNMLTDTQSTTATTDDFIAEMGSLDVDAATSFTNQGTPSNTTYFIVTDADGQTIFPGQQLSPASGLVDRLADEASTSILDEAGGTDYITDEGNTTQVFTVTAVSAASGGFRNVTVTPNLPAIPASGDVFNTVTTAVNWNTGVLQTTGVHVLAGDFFYRSADDYPMYVKPSTQYTFSVSVRCDTAGTGASFQASARIIWYDYTGQPISESVGTVTTLSTAYKTLTITATAPSNAYTAKVGIANETLVNPASATIALTGYASDRVNKGGTATHLQIPSEANVGDLALAWHYCNSQPTFSVPTGWTYVTSWSDSRGKAQLAYKILTQADLSTIVEWTINQTGKHWLALLATYSGINTAAPINVHAESIETTFQTGHTAPTVITTVNNCWLVNAIFDVSTTNVSWTVPGGYNRRIDTYCTGGNAATGVVADNATPVASGSHAGSSYASSVKSKFASMSTVAIAPATGTGPGSVEVWMGGWQFEQAASASQFAVGGNWLDLHTGLVDVWSKTFDGDLSLMQISSTDQSKRLSSINVTSALNGEIQNVTPVAYYKLDESGDTSTVEGANSALTSQNPLIPTQAGSGGTLAWAGGTGPDVDGTSAVKITKLTASNGLYLKNTLSNPIFKGDSVTLMVWWNSTDNDTSTVLGIAKASSLGTGTKQWGYVELRGNSGTNMQSNVFISSENTSVGALLATDATNYFDGKTHMLLGTYQITGGELITSLYVDGAQTASNSVACSPFTQFPTLDTFSVGTSYPSINICSGTYSYAVLFDYILDDDTIAQIYNAGKTAFAGDTVDARISRICGWAGLSNTSLEASDITCDRHMPDQKSVMDAIRQAAKTDGGTSFIDGSGNVVFKSRLGKESTVSTWLNVDSKYVQPAMAEVTDDQTLVNKAVVTRLSNSAKAVSNDAGSQLIHGTYEQDIDSIADSDVEPQNQADYLTAFYGTPTQRCDNIVIEGLFLQNWATIVNQGMWQIVTLNNLPSIEESSTINLYVEGWEHHIDDQSWNITYDTSTAIPFAILNDSARGVTGSVVVAW